MKKILALGFIVFLTLVSWQVWAATLTVTSFNDESSGGTLRRVVQGANSGDEIILPAGTYSISQGRLVISKNLKITGAGRGRTIIIPVAHNTETTNIPFDVYSGCGPGVPGTEELSPCYFANVEISGVSIMASDSGIKFFNAVKVHENAYLKITDLDITGTWASGISNRGGIVEIYDSYIHDIDIAGSSDGGGISNDRNNGIILLNNSIVANNRAINWGGGICSRSGLVTLSNSTITNNSARIGGGIYTRHQSAWVATRVKMRNTILAENTASSDSNCHVPELITDGYNYLQSGGDSLCQLANLETTDIITVGLPQLDANFTPLPGSPVINRGDPAGYTAYHYDRSNGQVVELSMGDHRVIDGDRIDIGAMEYLPPTLPAPVIYRVQVPLTQVDGGTTSGKCKGAIDNIMHTVFGRECEPEQEFAFPTPPVSPPPAPAAALCGNGQIDSSGVTSEPCDDGNTSNGDGCSSTCQIEQGWNCSGVPSRCAPISPIIVTSLPPGTVTAVVPTVTSTVTSTVTPTVTSTVTPATTPTITSVPTPAEPAGVVGTNIETPNEQDTNETNQGEASEPTQGGGGGGCKCTMAANADPNFFVSIMLTLFILVPIGVVRFRMMIL